MKKLFRFKYELCNGTCYVGDDEFYRELKPLSLEKRTELVDLVVKAHDKLCDNPNYFFGLDKCEKTGLFIGSFNQPTRLDLFTDMSLISCIQELCTYVINADIEIKSGECNFGENGTENLSELILKFSA